MRIFLVLVPLVAGAAGAGSQAPGKWPPDSLVNTQVIPRTTPVVEVWGTMRNIAFGLGVQCTFCHVGTDSAPLAQIDFASDQKRTKLVARQMLRMVQEINRRLDTIPSRPSPAVVVNCTTCHRGVARPVPLASIVAEAAVAAGADSAVRAYRNLRERFHDRDAYDFGEPTLNTAAFRTARAGKIDAALVLLGVNEGMFPTASALHITKGNVLLMRGDTASAADAFREALRRDPSNEEAQGRLRDIGKRPPHR
jgi:Photosynthetic reaction centre cytochrome C subunit